MNPPVSSILIVALATISVASAAGQVECSGWGEMRGIRVDGELVPIRTTLVIASPGWQHYAQTAHWRTRQQGYARGDDGSIVSTGEIGWDGAPAVRFKQTFQSQASGEVAVEIHASAKDDLDLEGLYVFVSVPGSIFGQGMCELASGSASFATTRPADDKHYIAEQSTTATFVATGRQVRVATTQPVQMIFQDDRGDQADPRLSLFFPLALGTLTADQQYIGRFTIRATGVPDRTIANIVVNATERGRAFDGVGGNFCWGTKSPTVEYYLNNLRVSWARVSIPLPRWQSEEAIDPTTRPHDSLDPEIQECLRIAGELHRRKIPIIASVWSAPAWAYAPPEKGRPPHRRGGRIDPAKWDALGKSIGSYLLDFKRAVGAEPELFSFNEPNIGINVLQSPDEHRDGIKLLGRHFESIGLRTRLLLGDVNDPRAVDFVKPALEDPAAMKYVGAVSYHSWNDGSDEQLRFWNQCAERAGVPLLVAEAGPDPDAHQYRAVLNEPWYALDEIALNLRCMALSRPSSILHWQLTPDYGLVDEAGGKILTTQRWFNYKQLDRFTPAGALYQSVSCDQRDLTVAALAVAGREFSVLHISNAGPARQVRLSGLPSAVRSLEMYRTDSVHGMFRGDAVAVTSGSATLIVPSQCFISLISP